MSTGPAEAPVATLIRRCAEELLEGGWLELLSNELVARIQTTVGDYADRSRISVDDLTASCRDNLRRALTELAEGSSADPVSESSPQQETGRRRAQQGLSLESLLAAYRLGGQVLWRGLVRIAKRDPEQVDMASLLDEATLVWEVIDRHSAEVATSYRDEQSRLASRGARRRQALLDALVDGQGGDPDVARDAAVVLGMPEHGAFLVVAASFEAGVEPLRSPEEALALHGHTSAWYVRAQREIGVIAVARTASADPAEVLARCLHGRVGLSPVVHGFGEIGGARRLAEAALQTLPAGQVGMARLTDHLPQALLVSSPVLTRLLIDDVLSEVLALRPREAEVLLDTLEAALECDGSPTQAARRLHIHRNTALNRLRRIETLTRRRLDRPHDRLRLHLAVLGLRMGRASPDGPLSRGEREREPRADPSR